MDFKLMRGIMETDIDLTCTPSVEEEPWSQLWLPVLRLQYRVPLWFAL